MLRFLHNSNATIFNFLFIGCGSCSTHRIIAFYFVSLRSLFATEANCDTLLHTCKSDGTWKIHSGNYLHINHTHLPSTSDAFISVWRSKLFTRFSCYSKSNEQSNIVGFYLGIHGGLMRMNVETSMSNHLYSIINPINPPRTKVWPNQSASHFFCSHEKITPISFSFDITFRVCVELVMLRSCSGHILFYWKIKVPKCDAKSFEMMIRTWNTASFHSKLMWNWCEWCTSCTASLSIVHRPSQHIPITIRAKRGEKE